MGLLKKNELTKKSGTERFRKKLHRQGAQRLRNAAYLMYAAVTKYVTQRSIWTFYETVKEAP